MLVFSPGRAAMLGLLLVVPAVRADDPPKKLNDKVKEIAGAAEFLRSVPKHFAILQAIDSSKRTVTLLIEGESLAKVWPLVPDAEIKSGGWWSRLDELTVGDRVWVWFKTDRTKQAVAISMLADEISEQDIHGPGVTVTARDEKSITLQPVKGKPRTLQTSKAVFYRETEIAPLDKLTVAQKVYVQSTGDAARVIVDPVSFDGLRAEMKSALCKRWAAGGLPGTVTFLHIFSGEMEYMLDHEAMRWGRSLKVGDKVTLMAEPRIQALVKQVTPWRERTQLRLVVHSFDQADLALGQRIPLLIATPPSEVDESPLPPDLDRPRTKAERIEWFLASIYCTCGVQGDVCTGHFYTLASCNVNGCGMPNAMRQTVAALIDKGMTDKQIFEALVKQKGPELLRPHLLP